MSPLRPAAVAGNDWPPLWWLPLGLSTMLLVLFAVVVNRQQAQAERIGALLSRVQTLEHSRALERTAVLEQQLRSMLVRLQDLEKQSQGKAQLAKELLTLQQEIELLRRADRGTSSSSLEPTPLERNPRQSRPSAVLPLLP